jgi:hypothetical protein
LSLGVLRRHRHRADDQHRRVHLLALIAVVGQKVTARAVSDR